MGMILEFFRSLLVPCHFVPCRTLSWKVHPPTSYCFAKHILFLLPHTSITLDARCDLLELTRFFTELSVIDYYFVGRSSSSVALAALLNSMENLACVPQAAIHELIGELRKIPLLDPNRDEVVECRERLSALYIQGGYGQAQQLRPYADERTETISPVCVSYDSYHHRLETK
jgi:Cyclin, C-terminal domain